MKKLALAAIAATFAIVTAAAPAMAEEGRHEGGRTVKKVVIHHDRGRHEGWRHRGGNKVVVIKKGGHHGSKTIIKKRGEG